MARLVLLAADDEVEPLAQRQAALLLLLERHAPGIHGNGIEKYPCAERVLLWSNTKSN